jgi:hypothetical protein
MVRMHNQSAAATTYAVPSAAERPEWITTRQKSRAIWESGDTPAGIADQAEETATPPATTELSAAAPTDAAEAAVAAQSETSELSAATQPTEYGLRAYGCAYGSTAQRLTISRPGQRETIRFFSHSCLRRVDHAQDGTGLVVEEAGDYEITFELCAAVKAASPVTFELVTGDEAIPGGTVTVILPGGMRQCRSGVMAPLQAGDRIGVMITSASVCKVEVAAGGAKLMIKKLD